MSPYVVMIAALASSLALAQTSAGAEPDEQRAEEELELDTDADADADAVHGEISLVGWHRLDTSSVARVDANPLDLGVTYLFSGVRTEVNSHFRIERFLQHPAEVGISFGTGVFGIWYPWERTGLTAHLYSRLPNAAGGSQWRAGLGAIHYLAPQWRVEGNAELTGRSQAATVATAWITPARGKTGAFFGSFLHRVELAGNRATSAPTLEPLGGDPPVSSAAYGAELRLGTTAMHSSWLAVGGGLKARASTLFSLPGVSVYLGGNVNAEVSVLSWLAITAAVDVGWAGLIGWQREAFLSAGTLAVTVRR